MVDVVLDVKTPADFAFGFVRVRSIEYKLIVVYSCCKNDKKDQCQNEDMSYLYIFVFYDDLTEKIIATNDCIYIFFLISICFIRMTNI